MRSASVELTADGIALVAIDMAGQTHNLIYDDYIEMMEALLQRLESGRGQLSGVILGSAKSSFVAGGDVNKILALRAEGTKAALAFVDALKQQFTRLENLGVPVVAAINGTALGGGLELALACHHRVRARGRKSANRLSRSRTGYSARQRRHCENRAHAWIGEGHSDLDGRQALQPR